MNSESDLSINDIHKALSNTSVDLHYIFYGVERDQQIRRPDENSWCPLEILIHLRIVGDVFSQRVKRIIEKHERGEIPFFHNFNEEKQMAKINLNEETLKYNLGRFMQARSQLLNKISFLKEEEWNAIKGQHETDGELTLRNLLIPLVLRERKLLKRIKQLLEKEN